MFESILLFVFVCILWYPPIVTGIQCERISVPACQGLGYNMTAMPNLAGHTSQEDAANMIHQLLPLLDSECSKHARFLLCASMFPLCSPDVSRPVAACKSLCETVKSECSTDSMLAILWPKFIDCDAMPQPEKQELCMQVPQEEMKFVKNAPNHFWPWMPWKNSHLPRPISPILCPTNFTPIDDECHLQCGTDALFTSQQKDVAEIWTLVLSAICFILTLFSLVTFWAEPMRFGYPERPVLFLALCYNLLSVCYLERVIFYNPLKEKVFDLEGTCSTTAPCLASYITTSYLTLSAASWWLVFSICWYLSTEKQWSSEALEKNSGIFHVLAWVPPLAPPICALLWGDVQPQELTGMCTTTGFIEIPAFILLVAGAIFTILASRSLQGLSITVNDDSFNRRLTQVRTRILIFSGVFFVPAFLAVILGFFDEIDNKVPACSLSDPCVLQKKPSAIPTLLRLFFLLAGGSLAGMWVWSKKTCEAYRSRISTSPSNAAVITKGNSSLVKKTKNIGPLYAGINFHNVPIYNTSARV